jgi:hypothetical protein
MAGKVGAGQFHYKYTDDLDNKQRLFYISLRPLPILCALCEKIC